MCEAGLRVHDVVATGAASPANAAHVDETALAATAKAPATATITDLAAGSRSEAMPGDDSGVPGRQAGSTFCVLVCTTSTYLTLNYELPALTYPITCIY